MATDLYSLLGVDRDASPDEIKKAYRKLARQLHPDANPGDAAAEARFKEVSQAYEILSDPEKRSQYDRFGSAGPGGGPGGADPFGFSSVSDLFEAFFGGGSPFGGGARGPSGPPRGSDLEVVLELDFEDAVFGSESTVELRSAVACAACSGSGASPGTGTSSCDRCGGAGQVRQVRQSILGQMVSTTVCPQCSGAGEVVTDPCVSCRGDGRILEDVSYQVRVPPGVDDGSTLRLSGRGPVGQRGGRAGDLYVHIRVRPHDRFVRRGVDVLEELPIAMTQAVFGARLDHETLDGVEELEIPPGIETGEVLRLRGKGVPRLEGRGRGDHLVTVVVRTPEPEDEEQEELLRRFAELRGESVADPSEGGLFSRLKSAFRGS